MTREFRLSAPGSGRGVSCDANGAFIGAISLLQRTSMHGEERWEPRHCEDLSKQLGLEFDLPIDMLSKVGGLKAICNALNEGDIARAQIATVLLGIPEPPALAKSAPSESDMIKFIRDLHWSGLIKRDWDPDFHPRWPAGAPESQGGQFAPIGAAIGAVVGAIENTEVLESNNNLAMGRAGANAIADGLKTYANYRAKPWIDKYGVLVQVPVINYGDPLSDAAALMGHDLFAPDEPLMRPATNADWIDPIVGTASATSIAAGPVLDIVGAGTTVAADSSLIAADAPFIILRAELPAGFDTTIPIGRFIPNPDLPPVPFGIDTHEQIGQLLQDAVGLNVKLILRTTPYQTGVDVEVPLDRVDLFGFRFGEIKPMSAKVTPVSIRRLLTGTCQISCKRSPMTGKATFTTDLSDHGKDKPRTTTVDRSPVRRSGGSLSAPASRRSGREQMAELGGAGRGSIGFRKIRRGDPHL